MSPSNIPVETGGDYYYKFETVKGFFAQSEDETDDTKFDFVNSPCSFIGRASLTCGDFLQRKQNFGLIDREYGTEERVEEAKRQWQSFEKYVRDLDEKTEKGVSYKVLFLGRHGQGWHNVAETKYGTRAWDVSFLFCITHASIYHDF